MTNKLKLLLLSIMGICLGLSFCSADGIYWNQTGGLISIVYNNGGNTITLQDRNLGATCSDHSNSCSYGYRYQFGNNYGFDGPVSSSNIVFGAPLVDLSDYGPGNYYNSNGTFYTDLSSSNFDIWGGVTATNEARQGPCPNGYYIIDNRTNILSILSSLGVTNFYSYLKMPLAGYMDYNGQNAGTLGLLGVRGNYWASNSYSSSDGYRINIYDTSNDYGRQATKSYGFSVRCFKDESVSPTHKWTKLLGDTVDPVPEINVLYNGDSVETITCNGDNIIQIEGQVTVSNNVFTPYFDISYKDEDNQSLVESYSKDILYLENGQFKKTFTGNNDWILTVQGGNCSENSFSGYLPTFEITGGIEDVSESGNIFNNFAENSVKFTLSNIPSYIQYVILLFILFFILGFIRKFRRK